MPPTRPVAAARVRTADQMPGRGRHGDDRHRHQAGTEHHPNHPHGMAGRQRGAGRRSPGRAKPRGGWGLASPVTIPPAALRQGDAQAPLCAQGGVAGGVAAVPVDRDDPRTGLDACPGPARRDPRRPLRCSRVRSPSPRARTTQIPAGRTRLAGGPHHGRDAGVGAPTRYPARDRTTASAAIAPWGAAAAGGGSRLVAHAVGCAGRSRTPGMPRRPISVSLRVPWPTSTAVTGARGRTAAETPLLATRRRTPMRWVRPICPASKDSGKKRKYTEPHGVRHPWNWISAGIHEIALPLLPPRKEPPEMTEMPHP
ncbi:MAG: hypothetical protein QOI83_3790, partial [Streptomycetaceae bacterium]|nr:hypothetical protein [Streptomycetaceae bacterium]